MTLALVFADCRTAVNAQKLPVVKVPIPQISYGQLDSMIHVRPYTAIYYWPSWCSACTPKIPEFAEVMRNYPSISFISVNDPSSRTWLPQRLIDYSDVIRGFYRIENHGRVKMIAINDRDQFNYFNTYYTKTSARVDRVDNFYLLDSSGTLLYQAGSGDWKPKSMNRILDRI